MSIVFVVPLVAKVPVTMLVAGEYRFTVELPRLKLLFVAWTVPRLSVPLVNERDLGYLNEPDKPDTSSVPLLTVMDALLLMMPVSAMLVPSMKVPDTSRSMPMGVPPAATLKLVTPLWLGSTSRQAMVEVLVPPLTTTPPFKSHVP